jgi:hypothetical protein
MTVTCSEYIHFYKLYKLCIWGKIVQSGHGHDVKSGTKLSRNTQTVINGH